MNKEKMIQAYIDKVRALGFTVTEPEYEEDSERALFIGRKVIQKIPILIKETVPVLRVYFNGQFGDQIVIERRLSYVSQYELLKQAQLFMETAEFFDNLKEQ